jgi:hypothetical protein
VSQIRIAVLGLYRSGSTAVAGILHHLGIHMGKEFWGHYYEPLWLSQQLREWWNEPHLVEKTSREERIRVLAKWIAEREADSHTVCGAKHPLLSLCGADLVSAWGPQTRFVWSHRAPEDSIASLESEGWWASEIAHGCQRTLWDEVSRFFSEQPHHRVEHLRLLNDPAGEIDRLIAYLELKPTPAQLEAAIRFVQPRSALPNAQRVSV